MANFLTSQFSNEDILDHRGFAFLFICCLIFKMWISLTMNSNTKQDILSNHMFCYSLPTPIIHLNIQQQVCMHHLFHLNQSVLKNAPKWSIRNGGWGVGGCFWLLNLKRQKWENRNFTEWQSEFNSVTNVIFMSLFKFLFKLLQNEIVLHGWNLCERFLIQVYNNQVYSIIQ